MSAEISETPSSPHGGAHPLRDMVFEEFEVPRGGTGGCVGEALSQLLDDPTLVTLIPKFVTTSDVRKICATYDLIILETPRDALKHLGDAPDNTPMVVLTNQGSSPHDSTDTREFGHFVFTRDLERDFNGVDELAAIIIKRSHSCAGKTQ